MDDGELWKVEHAITEEAQGLEMEEVADVDSRSRSLKKEEELWIQDTRDGSTCLLLSLRKDEEKRCERDAEAHREASRF